ncbi:hypothetical protein [Virgibacillus doumboii]|uniref:hypothetical protein n=1 Tax=Virgibacillus doumboii TaxID=2697503 RepID=UPI0013DF1C73|nr:hypothetical protein [Virgibacillus doumboii]
MEQRKELWDFVKIVSSICAFVGVPAFFYFFGYRLTGELTVEIDKLLWDNPFLYVVISAVVLGSVMTMLATDVEKNNYRLSFMVVLKTFAKIVGIVLLVAVVRYLFL